MSGEQKPGTDTATGTDPDAPYVEPGYQDKSFGQATARDAEFAEELMAESSDVEEAERRYDTEATGAPALRSEDHGVQMGPPDHDRLLRVYLRDHHAGANMGVMMARRTRDENAGNDFGRYLATFCEEIVRDRDALERIMRRLGHRPSKAKDTVGVVTERLGRLKLSGRLASYSPLSRVLEFEALMSAVETKRRLWDMLGFVESDQIDRAELDRLVERADDQLGGLVGQHRAAGALAFTESAQES